MSSQLRLDTFLTQVTNAADIPSTQNEGGDTENDCL